MLSTIKTRNEMQEEKENELVLNTPTSDLTFHEMQEENERRKRK